MKAVRKNANTTRTWGIAVRFSPLFLLFLSLWSHGAPEEPQGEIDWYQVEVVLFERLSGNESGDPEAWPKDITLDYPATWRKLSSSSDSSAVDAGPEPAFVLLPESERTLNESTGAIADDRAMRVLFHEAWRQPIKPIDEAVPIIIRGGNNYEEHTELEGSIQLSISRYLHVHTDLWLTQFVPNYGQESEHWPSLPDVPKRQPALPPVDVSTNLDTGALDLSDSQSAWELDAAPIDATPIDEYTSLIEQPFLIKEIVTLQQTRRMRSGELHYIDHPRLGMLIKIDNYNTATGEIER